MNRDKVARELVRLAKELTAGIQEGLIYELDLREALASSWSTPQWERLVRQVHRRGGGFVLIEEVDRARGVAMVVEANNPAARVLGAVQVPLDALGGAGQKVARDLSSGRNNPDINDVYSATSRVKKELGPGSTLSNAVEQFGGPATKRFFNDLANRLDDLADFLSKDWNEQMGDGR
jgi:hypothetical protein